MKLSPIFVENGSALDEARQSGAAPGVVGEPSSKGASHSTTVSR
jgi:hypothetical protein